MKTITIAYWHLNKLDGLPYEHNQSFDFSKQVRNKIINKVMKKGYTSMLIPSGDNLIIWIGEGKLGQR